MMSVDYDTIKQAIAMRCPRRARHLCRIYAEEHASGSNDSFDRIYAETKQLFGLDKLD